MKFSMTGQEKGDILIQVTLNRVDCLGWFDCNLMLIMYSIWVKTDIFTVSDMTHMTMFWLNYKF